MAPSLKTPSKKRGRPKTGRPSVDLGTPETRRYRMALLNVKKQETLPALSSAIDVLYHRGRLSQKAWQNALKMHRLWSKARRIMGAPRPLSGAIERPKGRSCETFMEGKDQKTLNRYRAIMADLTVKNPSVFEHVHYLLYRADPLDYPYLNPSELNEVAGELESVTI